VDGCPVNGEVPEIVILPFNLDEELVYSVAHATTGSRPMVKRVHQLIFMSLAGYVMMRQEDGSYLWVKR
jgi:hypothetical protein